MIPSAVRIGARSLNFGASEYRQIVRGCDLAGAQRMADYFRGLARRSATLNYMDVCSAAYWASIADAITARQS
jgi:hypothetical protein